MRRSPGAARAALVLAGVALLAACSSNGGVIRQSASSRLLASSPAATSAATATRSGGPTGPQPVNPPRVPPPAAPLHCPTFPSDNIWHAKVTSLPVDAHSAVYVSSIGAGSKVHADFGSGTYDGGPIGIPVTTVSASQAKVSVRFTYSSESDKGPYPLSASAKIEGGPSSTGDRHVILLDPSACRDYELYDVHHSGSTWTAGSGAIFDLRSNALRPADWTSADAAGLAILPGLVQYSEVASGSINHAIRMTVPSSQAAYVWPARHQAGSGGSSLPPMGQRFRLKASVNISGLPTQARIVAQALKTYGAIVADNGSAWYISGTPDSRWDNDALHALGTLPGSDFEAVSSAGLMISSSSGAAR